MNLYDRREVERVWQRVSPGQAVFGRGGKPAGAQDGLSVAKQLLLLSDGYRRLGLCAFCRQCAAQAQAVFPGYALSPGMRPEVVTRQSQRMAERRLLEEVTGSLAEAGRNRLRY